MPGMGPVVSHPPPLPTGSPSRPTVANSQNQTATPSTSYSSKDQNLETISKFYKEKFSDTSQYPFYKEPTPKQDGSVVLQFQHQAQASDFFKVHAKNKAPFLFIEEGKSAQDAIHIFSFGDGNTYEGKADEVRAKLKQESDNAQGNTARQGEILNALALFNQHTSSAVSFRSALLQPASTTTPTPTPPTPTPTPKR